MSVFRGIVYSLHASFDVNRELGPDGVRVGWYQRNNDDSEKFGTVGRDVGDAGIFIHPSYDDATFEYGFLLIKLDGSSTKAFPKLNNDASKPVSETTMSVIGRGNQKASGFNEMNILFEAEIPFIETSECEKGKSHGGWTYTDTIGDSQFCAGSDEVGACESDWGGPVVETAF